LTDPGNVRFVNLYASNMACALLTARIYERARDLVRDFYLPIFKEPKLEEPAPKGRL
jgi:hypothetical protein